MSRIEDVAKLAGVSTATVSRVLNNTSNVSEDTRQKVMKAIEELDYTPSQFAKALAKKTRNYELGVLTSERIENILNLQKDNYGIKNFYSIMLKGISDSAGENGLNLRFNTFEKTGADFLKTVDALIIIGGDSFTDTIQNSGLPIVLVDNYIPGKLLDCVISNGFDGAYYATEKFIKKGYKRVFHIHGSLNFFGFKNRYEGYCQAMEHYGLLPETLECDETSQNISYITDMAMKKKPDVIFASNDPVAIMILEHLKNKGVSVPQDVQIIGFDDIFFSSVVTPKLSTVKVFKYEMGSVAVNRIVDLLNNKNRHPSTISLFTEFVARETTK